MDKVAVGRLFNEMTLPPKNSSEFEPLFVSEDYMKTTSSDDHNLFESEILYLNRNTDLSSVREEILRFITALEANRKQIETVETNCFHSPAPLVKKMLTSFIDSLYYYVGCEANETICTESKSIILCFEGTVLSAAGQAVAQSLATGCAVVLLTYKDFSSTARLLSKIWNEAKLPEKRLQVRTDFPKSSQTLDSSLKIFVGGQLSQKNYSAFKPYFIRGHTVPLLLLEGADIESVISIVTEKSNLLRHQQPWAISLILVQESQLNKFKTLLLEKIQDSKTTDTDKSRLENVKKLHLLNKSAEVHQLTNYRYVVFGSEPNRSNRLWPHDLNGSPVYVLPVRTAAEAVKKANHYSSGYAASIFTEDGSLSQWVSEKLEVSTVWINTVGQLHPAAPLPYQVINSTSSGHCTLNIQKSTPSISGLLNLGNPLAWKTEGQSTGERPNLPVAQEIIDKVKAAVTAQSAWASVGGLGRCKALINLFSSSEARIKSSAPSLADDLDKCSHFFKNASATGFSYANQEPGSSITTYILPLGVIAVYVHNNETNVVNLIKTIQGVIAHGNTCIVLLADSNDYQLADLLYGPSSNLSKGVITLIRSKEDALWVSLLQHMDVRSLWHTGSTLSKEHDLLKHFEAKDSKRIWIGINKYIENSEKECRVSLKTFEPYATTNKHVWRNSQQTS